MQLAVSWAPVPKHTQQSPLPRHPSHAGAVSVLRATCFPRRSVFEGSACQGRVVQAVARTGPIRPKWDQARPSHPTLPPCRGGRAEAHALRPSVRSAGRRRTVLAALAAPAALAGEPTMSGRFLVRRSQVAREQAQRTIDVSTEKIANLVALATSLADRTEAMPSAGLDGDRQRRDRVRVLRRAAEAGRQALDARDRLPRSDDQDTQQSSGG